MKKYENVDNFHDRMRTVQVTLQMGEYKGHIAFKVGENCFGADLLEVPFVHDGQSDIDRYVLNDCHLKYDKEDDLFTCVLNSDEGEEVECEFELRELENCVVAIEIIDCVIKK